MATRWQDRADAGRQLGAALEKFRSDNPIVYGLPRGGVAVAAEVARYLSADLDVLVARKIGHPGHPEYAVGAVTTTGKPVLNDAETSQLNATWLSNEIAVQRTEAKRRRELFRQGRQRLNAAGRVAIIVDDGIATGYTMLAAIEDLKTERPRRIIIAVPVAPADTASEIEAHADEMVCLDRVAEGFGAVGSYYSDFAQVEDDEVVNILSEFEPSM